MRSKTQGCWEAAGAHAGHHDVRARALSLSPGLSIVMLRLAQMVVPGEAQVQTNPLAPTNEPPSNIQIHWSRSCSQQCFLYILHHLGLLSSLLHDHLPPPPAYLPSNPSSLPPPPMCYLLPGPPIWHPPRKPASPPANPPSTPASPPPPVYPLLPGAPGQPPPRQPASPPAYQPGPKHVYLANSNHNCIQ